jgi:hypothetical protein
MRCTAHKVAPDDGLIQSETRRASNKKIKSNHKNSVHLVGLYTYGSEWLVFYPNTPGKETPTLKAWLCPDTVRLKEN